MEGCREIKENPNAAQMLKKLLRAAKKAHEEGKYLALHRLILEANRLSENIAKERDEMITVHGELIV